MPPRHAYWTIIVDEQPTSFRAHDVEELLPTFNRLREKHPSAVLKWFERGRLWESRDAARQAGGGTGERGRWRDENARTDDVRSGRASDRDDPRRGYPRRDDVDHRDDDRRGGARSGGARSGGALAPPERQSAPPERQSAPPERQSASPEPPAERERRDRKWRPGGEHRDPRQKFKDAKKAKWTRLKQDIRSKWEDRQSRGEESDESRVDRPEPDRGEHTPPHGDPLRSKVSARPEHRDSRPPFRREDRRDSWKPAGPPRDRDARPRGDRDDPRGGWQPKTGGWKPKGRPPAQGGWRRDDRDRDQGGWKPKGPPRDREQGRASGEAGARRFETPTGRKPWTDKPAGARKPWGAKPAGARKPWGAPRAESRGAKPAGERKPWSAKPGGGRKPWGPKPEGARKPWGPKSVGARKPWGAKSEGARKPWGPKPEGPRKPWGAKPEGARKPWGKPAGRRKPWQGQSSSGPGAFRGRKKPFAKGPRKRRDDEE